MFPDITSRNLGELREKCKEEKCGFWVQNPNNYSLSENSREYGSPFLHIAEVTADQLCRDDIKNVALLGTRFTMEKDFYKKVLMDRGINVLIPEKEQIEKIHEIINKELILGKIEDSSRKCFKSIILSLRKRGAQGVILGCTEIGLLIKQEDSSLPVPSLSESIGMARAMEQTALPYIISFMLLDNGKLIDGTTINDAILQIDNSVNQKPVCYMTNCIHPTILYKALSYDFNKTPLVKERFHGIQANTSVLSPEELDNSDEFKLMGTKGEIRGAIDKYEIEIIEFSSQIKNIICLSEMNSKTGHHGGDIGLIRDFVRMVQKDDVSEGLTSANISVQSHIMAFAAEKSRLEKKIIHIEDYLNSLMV